MNAIRTAAVVAGALALLSPLASLIVFSRRKVGRAIGAGSRRRQWPVVLAMLLVFVGVGGLLWKPLPLDLTSSLELVISVGSALIYFPAIFLYLWGLIALGKGFAVSSRSGAHLPLESSLVVHGPYRWVRHPMYLAVIAAAVGALLMFRTWAMVLFMPMSLVVVRRAAFEEILLEEEFDDAWRDYAANVPKWIPAFLWTVHNAN